MKILVATKKTQGQRKSDFCHTIEGEMVIHASVCNKDRNVKNPDGGCGCNRSLVGVITHKATTTVEVADWSISKNQFIRDYIATLQDAGFYEAVKDKQQIGYIKIVAHDLLNNADRFEVGDVLEYRDLKFSKRKQ
jgi:hypothetical protein